MASGTVFKAVITGFAMVYLHNLLRRSRTSPTTCGAPRLARAAETMRLHMPAVCCFHRGAQLRRHETSSEIGSSRESFTPRLNLVFRQHCRLAAGLFACVTTRPPGLVRLRRRVAHSGMIDSPPFKHYKTHSRESLQKHREKRGVRQS